MNDWRELKTLQDVAEAQKNGDEIEVSDDYVSWYPWSTVTWIAANMHRARPHQPKMKQVKMLCLTNGKTLVWNAEDVVTGGLIRVPNLDYIIEIPE